MLIGFSSQSYDLDGDLVCHREGAAADHLLKRRVSRSTVIGGGAVIDDMGFSHGDSTLIIDIPFSDRAAVVLTNLIKNHPVVGLSTVEGFFQGAVSELQKGADGNVIRVTFIVEQGW